MKIFTICSKAFYDRVPEIKEILEHNGHEVTLPNSFDDPTAEERHRALGSEQHSAWKETMLKHSTKVIVDVDAVLVLNFDKKGLSNYIGGATFLEMYDAFRLGKRIYLYNDIPDGMLHDEILGFNPKVIHGDVSLMGQ